jgi:hypothetical protein
MPQTLEDRVEAAARGADAHDGHPGPRPPRAPFARHARRWRGAGPTRRRTYAEGRNLIEARGATIEFLPPYAPAFDPIEPCWAKVKAGLRKAKARTFEALLEALAQAKALRAVSPEDAAAWFAHCGYAVNPKA